MNKPPKDIGGEPPGLRPETRLVVSGRDPQAHHGYVNPPVYHASTLLYSSAEDLIAHRSRYSYGRKGTPTTEALESALAELEGPACAGVALLPSGLAAISTAILSIVDTGDHILVSDSVYRPTRVLADTVLARLGVATTYYDPLAGAGIAALFQPNTKAVFVEAPGSQSFEMQDIPAIAAVTKARNAAMLMDNTWATPLFFRAFDKGVDISIQAGTKYIGGHSDIMFGTISVNASYWQKVRDTSWALGLCAGPDDVYLALRGLRTMAVRLTRHQESGLRIASWLAERPEVLRVLHPGLPENPGYAIWKRDFTGASGLFSVVLKPVPDKAVHAFLNTLTLFGLGFSWGGYESLVIPFDCSGYRSAVPWTPGGPALRMHIGLENVDDLLADLERGFAALVAAR